MNAIISSGPPEGRFRRGFCGEGGLVEGTLGAPYEAGVEDETTWCML